MSDPFYETNPYARLHIYYLEGRIESLPRVEPDDSLIGNWEEDGSSFLFFSSRADDRVDGIIRDNPGLSLIERYEMTCEEWHGDRIESYKTGRLCISPPWKIPYLTDPDLRHILLDPGVVFGTGRHPTTEECLGFLETLLEREPIETAVDIGCGTGLLALAAAALGCRHVLALDFNFLAARTTLNNVRLNDMEDQVLTIQGSGRDFMDVPADLVIANIHYDVMKDLIASPGFLEKRWFILSGLLKTEAGLVISRLSELPVTVEKVSCPDGIWHTIFGRSQA